MYSPIGFLNFTTVLDAATRVARQHVDDTNSQRQVSLGGATPLESRKDIFKRREAEVALMMAWLLSKAMCEFGAYICSPSGTVLRCAHLLHFHNDLLDWYDWPSDVSCHDELGGPFNRAIRDRNIHPADRFRFIDGLTGTISVAQREAKILALLHEHDECGATQIAIAKQFDLWAVCFRAEDMQPNLIEALQALLNRNLEHQYSSSATGKPLKGRPRKVDRAMHVYDEIYPRGHGVKTWPEVAGEVSEITEETIHHETLMKAVNRRKQRLLKE